MRIAKHSLASQDGWRDVLLIIQERIGRLKLPGSVSLRPRIGGICAVIGAAPALRHGLRSLLSDTFSTVGPVEVVPEPLKDNPTRTRALHPVLGLLL